MLNNPSNNTIFNHQQFNSVTKFLSLPQFSNLKSIFYHFNTQTSLLLPFPNTNQLFLTTSPQTLTSLQPYILSICPQLQNKSILLFYILFNPTNKQYYSNTHTFINQTLNQQPIPNKLPPLSTPTYNSPTPTPTPQPTPIQPQPIPSTPQEEEEPLPPIQI
tara:strand:- start:3055 stop:3537 length:483 start_codon:yes stop_codon:yes gene_type:complete